jgi:Holliday junction resolvase RusA-like endonuclease
MYDPETSRDWKRTVLDRVASWVNENNFAPFEAELRMQLIFRLPRPKSLPKKVVFHTLRPDADNLAKAVKDAMKGIVYRDDSQVVFLAIEKKYAEHAQQTGVEIHLW